MYLHRWINWSRNRSRDYLVWLQTYISCWLCLFAMHMVQYTAYLYIIREWKYLSISPRPVGLSCDSVFLSLIGSFFYLFGRAQTNVTLGLSLLVSVATLEHSRSNLQVNIDTIIHMDKLPPGRSATTRGVCRILRFWNFCCCCFLVEILQFRL